MQYYGSERLDASLLLIPLVGFLPADDPRVVGTVAAIERELLRDGFVERYRADHGNVEVDGLPPGEGVFLPCSFWLAAVRAQQGRLDEAVELYERLLSLRNDLGLLSEEYDPERKRLLGNFPQAFTHLTLVETAFTLTRATRRARRRAGRSRRDRRGGNPGDRRSRDAGLGHEGRAPAPERLPPSHGVAVARDLHVRRSDRVTPRAREVRRGALGRSVRGALRTSALVTTGARPCASRSRPKEKALAVVDIDTLWRDDAPARASWLGRTCKVYAFVDGEWKMTAQTGALRY